MKHDVKGGLRSAQRWFVLLVISYALAIGLCYPRLSDAHYAQGLTQADALVQDLNIQALEQTIAKQAESKTAPTLPTLAETIAGRGVVPIRAATQRPRLFRANPVKLDRLQDLVAYASGEREVRVTGPELARLSTSLRWRLARHGGGQDFVLESLALADGSASQSQLSTEAAVEPTRLEVIRARKRYKHTLTRFKYLRDRVKAMTKRRAPRKRQWKVQKKKRKAYSELEAAKQSLESATDAYRTATDAARAFEPERPDQADGGVVVLATLTNAEGKELRWVIPTPNKSQAVESVPFQLSPALSALSQGPLWPEIKHLAPADLRSRWSKRLSWHMASPELGPVHTRGVTALHFVPVGLLLCMRKLGASARAARRAFSPFHHPGSNLPRFGTGSLTLDRILLVMPPIVIGALTVWTLARLEAYWWLALPLSLTAVAYSFIVSPHWSELYVLRDLIQRTSLPPPLPG